MTDPGDGTRPVVFDTRVITGSGGGPDKTILNSPRFLDALGYRMVCGYLHPPGDPGYQQIIDKAARYGAPLVSVPDRGPWDWRVVTTLLAACRRERVTVWHGHDYKTNALGLVLKRFHPMRLVTTLHGWVEQTARTPLYFRVDRACLPRYERVICVSEDLLAAARAAGVPSNKCVLLENAIDTTEFRRAKSVAEAKTALGYPAGCLVVGGVGRLSPEKAFDVLIRAVPTLVASGVDIRVIVVGEGGDRGRLENLARELNVADRVHLPGWRADVRGMIEAFDIFALPSLREGLPNVLLEAMALGVPCVASRIAGIPRLITDGTDGLLVGPGDLGGLTAALGSLLADPTRRAEIAAAGRATIEARYSFAARMRKLAAVYDELLAGPTGRRPAC